MFGVAQCMQELHAMECSFVPCGGDVGKKPLVKWTDYQRRRPTMDELCDWQKRYSKDNVGIVTGALSGITVIDSDNPHVKTGYLQEVFGETPLIVSTPRGGIHLYYRYDGESNKAGLIHGDNLKIDVRGEGGIIIAPPSKNPQSHKSYQIIEGDYKYIKDLPPMNSSALNLFQHANPKHQVGRNDTIFLQLKESVIQCSSLDQLLSMAYQLNESFSPPLPLAEVKSTVRSVWKMKENGKIFIKGDSFVRIHSEHILSIGRQNADAFLMLCDLQRCHGHSVEPFAVSPLAYADRIERSLPTTKKALRYLQDQGLLIRVHIGGRYKGDASLYRLVGNRGKIIAPI
ncbi:MAG: bifunctional DNA primase/polymerase [Rickettsiales bacterium]